MTRRLQEVLGGQWGRNVYYEYVPLPGLECSRENEKYKELEAKEGIVVPGTVPEKYEVSDVTHTLYNFSEGEDIKPVVDGKEAADGNDFNYIKNPQAMADKPILKAPPAQLHSTPPEK